jgi:hypothetical protein
MHADVLREVIVPASMRAVNEAIEDLGIAPDRVVSVLYVEAEGGGKYRVIYRADPLRPHDLVTRG